MDAAGRTEPDSPAGQTEQVRDAAYADYYGPILAELEGNESGHLSVRTVAGQGKGLFTSEAHKEGEVVYMETKMLGMQELTSREAVIACEYCMRFVGSLESHMVRIHAYVRQMEEDEEEEDDHVGSSRGRDADADNAAGKEPSLWAHSVPCRTEAVPCAQRCGEVYCSQACADAAWGSYHALLCPRREGERGSGKERVQELDSLTKFAAMTNGVFMLAAKFISNCIQTTLRRGNDEAALAAARIPVDMFCNDLWWNVVQLRDAPEEEATAFTASLRGTATAALDLLVGGLKPYSDQPLFAPLFSLDFFSRLLGMFEMNNLGMCARSPLQALYEELEGMTQEERDAAMAALGPQWCEFLEDHNEWVAEGTGMYTVGCCMNHSCAPNIALLKAPGIETDRTAFVATRDIAAGEQLFNSYIDEDMPVEDRRDALQDYQFLCMCSQCQSEDHDIAAAEKQGH